MAPKRAKENGGGRPKNGATGAGEDDDLFVAQGGGRWSDGFIVISLLRCLFDAAAASLRPAEGHPGPAAQEGKGSPKKKEKAAEKAEPREMLLHWVTANKIPAFLMAVGVLVCAVIIGGESYTSRSSDRRDSKPADDFYGVLGVERDAEAGEVKRAYKTLAKRWHPDKNPDCSSCKDTFAKIAEAYETLSDEEKRAAYDASGEIASSELKSPRSVPLTQDNFDELVKFSNDVWIVQIYKPAEGFCVQFHPFWENQVQKNGHLVRFGRVDITHDDGRWLGVKPRVLPMVLKFSKHLGSPEILPILATHEIPQNFMKFVLTSFPNIGLPLHKDPDGLRRWLSGSSRRHKVLLAIPGRSEEERYKSHLVPRKLASTWGEVFEFRSAETAELHRLPRGAVSAEVLAALPNISMASSQAAILFFAAAGGPGMPRASAIIPWPTGEDQLVLQLLRMAELAAPAVSARSAELLCRSLPIKRVYCLVMLDPSDADVARTSAELADSRAQYTREVADIRANGGDVSEDEDNFVVSVVRLFRQQRGLQPSVATCRCPRFSQVERAIGGAPAFLMDMDTGRVAALRGLSSFRGLYPQIAYEDNLRWADDALHPFLSLPDCDEGMSQNFVRQLRGAGALELVVQLVTVLLLLEAIAKAAVERSPRWCAGAASLMLLVLLRSPPFLRAVAGYLPSFLIAPPLLVS